MSKNREEEKTNAMRLLDAAGVAYTVHNYQATGAVSGREVAAVLGQDTHRCFKTLVTKGRSGAFYVFVVPVCGELDRRAAARAVGEKSVDMILSRELLPLTGYIHGGCSPLGMKKRFKTVLDESAMQFETICCSGGRIGLQVELSPAALLKTVPCSTAAIAEYGTTA